MSKYSDDFEKTMKDVGAVKKATKDVIAEGGKVAFEEIHDAGSFERLKKRIREGK